MPPPGGDTGSTRVGQEAERRAVWPRAFPVVSVGRNGRDRVSWLGIG